MDDVFFAVVWGGFERVKAVIEQNAGLVHATDNNGATPLMSATFWGHVKEAQYLLGHGASVNYRDHNGYTALHLACCGSHPPVVLLLLQRGADVSAVDQSGRTPLMSAASGGHTSQLQNDVVRALLEHGGSDVDAADQNGWTVCHWACHGGYTGVLKQLLEAGADPRLRDSQGRTARDHAVQFRHHDCIGTIQEWGRAYVLRGVRCVRDASSESPSDTPQQSS